MVAVVLVMVDVVSVLVVVVEKELHSQTSAERPRIGRRVVGAVS